MKKKIISLMTAAAMTVGFAAYAEAGKIYTAEDVKFADISTDTEYADEIIKVSSMGDIITGFEDNTFRPDKNITRAEAAKMLAEFIGYADDEVSDEHSNFADVDGVNHWAKKYIAIGVAFKYINGMGDGNFEPEGNVTYAQFVKMLVSVIGYGSAADSMGGWPNGYIMIGSQLGITEGTAGVAVEECITRAQAAKLISNALDIPIVVVTNWTIDVFGRPVAATEVLDGTGESGKYETISSSYHDIYVINGKITQIKNGIAKFAVASSNNLNGGAVTEKDKITIDVNIGKIVVPKDKELDAYVKYDAESEEYVLLYAEDKAE